MRYREEYQATHDIDWFFRCNGLLYHVASNGGRVPDYVDSRNNRKLQSLIERKPIKCNASLLTSNNAQEDLSSFVYYAKKGFISIDRLEGDFERQEYRVVAWPLKGDYGDSSNSDQDLLDLIPERASLGIKLNIDLQYFGKSAEEEYNQAEAA